MILQGTIYLIFFLLSRNINEMIEAERWKRIRAEQKARKKERENEINEMDFPRF